MTESENVVGAFSEEHAEKLTGISRHQLRRWDRTGFLRPSYGHTDRHEAFSRIYSFRDLVALRVLNDLRNNKKVPLQHLREVSRQLAHLGDAKWTSTTLYVLGRRVVLEDPTTKQRSEIVSGQGVLGIPLRVVISDTRKAVRELNLRGADEVGQVVQARFVMQNEPVFAGTRIPVAAVQRYLDAGFTAENIVREYPQLTREDVDAARTYKRHIAA